MRVTENLESSIELKNGVQIPILGLGNISFSSMLIGFFVKSMNKVLFNAFQNVGLLKMFLDYVRRGLLCH